MSSDFQSVEPGTIVGPYRIVHGFASRGGMAQVFEVEVRRQYHQLGIPDRLALKVAAPEHQAALVAEADYLRMFDHPNVVKIYPLPGFHKPVYAARAEFPFGLGWYYAMELLRGGSLQSALTRSPTIADLTQRSSRRHERRLSVHVALGLAVQLADALQHIHDSHIVNLDIKPSNVLFRRRRWGYFASSVPQAVLGDFGIARDLRYPRAGLLGVATPEYVSPEHAAELQIRPTRSRVDCRSDIFSLGVLLYEMLTGEIPFRSVDLILDDHYCPPEPLSLRPALPSLLNDIVMRALRKAPEERFQSAAELRKALQELRSPMDWPRWGRIVALVPVLGALLGGGLWLGRPGGDGVLTTSTPSPTAALTLSPSSTPSPEPTATVTPTATKSSVVFTSTPRPTLTPTATPVPLTPTPTGIAEPPAAETAAP